MLPDLQLLARYHLNGDAAAFRDLVQAHAGMVFATARRITRNETMAEDVAQETFFQLARQSRHITQSVAAWLHRVAWRRACNAVRDDATRRRIEEEAVASEAAVIPSGEREATWADVESVLDAAIDELPDNLRAPLVMHFLQGRAQRDIAEQLGVSQSTVSRLVDDGLSTLRNHLKARGVICGAGLAALLLKNNATAAPAALLTSLGKLSMSGIGAATTIATSASTAFLLKAGLAVLVAASAFVVMRNPVSSEQKSRHDVNVNFSGRSKQLAQQKDSRPAIVLPEVAMSARPPPIAPVPTPAAAHPAPSRPMPTHELVHSFPKPPMHPSGHMVRDAAGWLWGTVQSGGEYGLGAIYKMRTDGTDWQIMLSFNGIEGVPRGKYPRGGLTLASDGTFWGVTESGGEHDGGTLYHFNPQSGAVMTRVEFKGVGPPWSRPWIAEDGRLWGTTHFSIYCFEPKSGKVTTIGRFTGSTGRLRGSRTQAGLTPDGLGFLWGATGEGGSSGNGTIFKVNLASGEAVSVLDFTGKDGAFIGKQPVGDLTLGADGFLWGTTRNGGSNDFGTVFKIAAATNAFTHVAEFNLRNRAGQMPETKLAADGTDFLWGTTNGGGEKGHGSIYKVNARTGEIASVVALTGIAGEAMGGPARGHLLPDGEGGLFGACDFGGRSWLGVLYRVDIKSGSYTLLKDIADTAPNAEGSDVRGTLVSDDGGWLWGGTMNGGAYHSGTIFKMNPVTDEVVTVVHFTGADGPCRGSFSHLPLIRDGKGFLWGSTRLSHTSIFKINELTGEFTEVIDFSNEAARGVQAPFGGMTFDRNGFLWIAGNDSIAKVDPNALAMKTIARVKGGWLRGALTLDGNGMMWGCTQAFPRSNGGASLFKVDTATDTLTVLRTFTNADAGWNGWNPETNMWWDGAQSLWFSAVFDVGTGTRQCTLYELNTHSGQLIGGHRSNEFRMINSPVMDKRGMLWGTGSQFGFASPGYLYTFDTHTREFAKLFDFTGIGSQERTGAQADVARLTPHVDGNYYGLTRMGGPGNGGTIYRLRFGPTPMTQQAVTLSDGRVELRGTLRPNGRATTAAFEWGTDPTLEDAHIREAGVVGASEVITSVEAALSNLPRGITHYFRLRGSNADNAVPQRGAILQFVIPEEKPHEPLLAASSEDSAKKASPLSESQKGAQVQADSDPAPPIKHRLRVIMVPGAGAGIVRGHLRGEAYEIGRSYMLTAQADNGYLFAQWSGVGIGGPAAENPQLSFTFTEELARRPFVTATFVRNPFHKGLIGDYHGLVNALDEVPPDIRTTGAVEIQISAQWTFTGTLHLDGDDLPFAGVFDIGGNARFSEGQAFIGAIPRKDKPTLLLSLQLDFSVDGRGGVIGHVGLWNGGETNWHSRFHSVLGVPATSLTEDVVIQHLVKSGALAVEIVTLDSGEALPAQVLLQPDGRLLLSASLPDGIVVLSHARLSLPSQISFFQPFDRGNIGVKLPLANLLHAPDEAVTAHGWWLPSGAAMRPITIRPAPAEASEK